MPAIGVTEDLPRFLAPMLCSSGVPESHDGWQLQVKFDGIRGHLRAAPSGWTLRTRPGADRSESFPELASIAVALAEHRVLLDGEVVVFDDHGRPDFAAVRRRLTAGRTVGERLRRSSCGTSCISTGAPRALPLLERQALLADLLPEGGAGWCIAEPLDGSLTDVLSVVAAHQLEGMVAKRVDSRWEPARRSPHWRKIKLRRRHECTVAGWLPATESQPEALLLRDAHSRPAGQVTFGGAAAESDALREAVLALAEAPRRKRGVRRMAPGIVVTVDPIYYLVDATRAGLTGVHASPVRSSTALAATVAAMAFGATTAVVARGWRLKP